MRPGALNRLTPPWEPVTIEKAIDGELSEGSEVVLTLRIGPIKQRWHALHTTVKPESLFVDYQQKGPFAFWNHQHHFLLEENNSEKTFMKDEIEYRLPLSPVSDFFAGSFVESKLWRMFQYRHATLANDLGVIEQYTLPHKTFLISGASGLLGQALVGFLSCAGHTVRTLVRREPKNENEFQWNPSASMIDKRSIEGVDVVIHLSGESIASGRWNREKKEKIIKSRVTTTRLITDLIAECPHPPKLLITASGIGYYGNCGDKILTEESPKGETFLAEVAKRWEKQTESLKENTTRVVHMRLGAVMSPKGGALQKMLLPFSLGLGGRLGSGEQYFSWIALDDVLYALYHVIATQELSGPINFCAPQHLTNSEFTKAFGRVIKRPTPFPAPAPLLRLLLGEMADELLLSSTNAIPDKLLQSGFTFRHPTIELALKHQLGMP